ncbi:DUF3105 domain-containing protein [Actinotalea sp. AC32]|nr:DUF3105 domain-containing protein [Actinotalea sp. AC32]
MSTHSKRSTQEAERQARLAALREVQAKTDRRRRNVMIAVGAVVALGLIVPTAIVVMNQGQRTADVEAAAAAPIEGEEQVEVPSASHVAEPVPYESVAPTAVAGGSLPPLGGDHDPVVQNCGFYSAPVRDENVVHSLEHGAVWLTYQEGLDATQVERLRELTEANLYVLASPYPDLAAPVVATAWGVQVALDSVDDERLEPFIARYQQGEQTPEPGAPCSGGIGQ